MRGCLKLAVTLLCLGCGRLSAQHEPVFHAPLVNGAPRGKGDQPPPSFWDSEGASLRAEAAAFARQAASASAHGGDFGLSLVTGMLASVGVRAEWWQDTSIIKLTREARRRRAYAADGKPLPGDIVLFHNQYDADGDGENDDWLTGCGVVVDMARGQFTAVVATGHHPRAVVVTPLHPSVHTADGRLYNSFVRVPSRSDPPDTLYLAGQLYAGHIDVSKLPLE